MLIHYTILLLLSWRCVRSIENEKELERGVPDQIATASESFSPLFDKNDGFSASTTTAPDFTRSTGETATIYYENSNGFVPMTSVDGSLIESSVRLEVNSTLNDEDQSLVGSVYREESGFVEDDPAYSTEARLFMNLPGPSADRRSFDGQDGQNDFEILKVNNETPAIANYHDFYENLQSNLHRNRGGTRERYEESDESSNGRTNSQIHRTKDRIKKIEKYLANLHDDRNSGNSNPYSQYYNFDNGNNNAMITQNKAKFEAEKVQTNLNQHIGSSIYDVYGQSPSTRQRTSSMLRSNYEDSSGSSRNSQNSYGSATMKNRHINSKPVVVLGPTDYKFDIKYGTQEPSSKPTNVDNYKNQKVQKESSESQVENIYDQKSLINSEDRYGYSYERSEDNSDYSDESNDYLEITERPRRIHKSRRRPNNSGNSRRLPKEHRGHFEDDLELDDDRKNNSPTRAKLHRPKAKPSYWTDDEVNQTSEESSEERPNNGRPSHGTKTEGKSHRHQKSKPKSVTNWSQVGPNLEVSHSDGFELDQIDKPNLLVPVNVNLLPLPNFDHSTALGNSEGFDLSNVPNLVTATPIVSTATPLISTSPVYTSNTVSSPNPVQKNIPNSLNGNYGISTAVPDIIVGQNSFQNSVQAVILPQMNLQNKLTPNLRTHYVTSTVSPMFTVTQTMNPNLQSISPTVQNIPVQTIQSTVSSRPPSSMPQNLHHLAINPVTPAVPVQPQLLLPQSTFQSYPLLQTPYNGHSNYNILVNPNGLQGQHLIQPGGIQGGNSQNSHPSSTTSQPHIVANGNLHGAESQIKKNSGVNSNGQFLATASFTVGNADQHQQQHQHQQQQQQQQQQGNNANDNKYFLPSNNFNGVNNNNNYFNGNQNNQHAVRQQQQNFYQVYRQDQNSNPKIKTYLQTSQVVPAIIHSPSNIPVNFNNQNYANVAGPLQEQQSVLTPNIVAQRPRDQNQQILKAANDIFENTWKQLQQLQTNEDATKNLRMPYQSVYRVNDNLSSTSNNNFNTVNSVAGFNGNSEKAQLPTLGTQNVEIVNPNIKPSPVDLSVINPYQTLHHYPAAVLTTPIPLFSTTAAFLTPRPAITSTTPDSINVQRYVDSLTQVGAHSNQLNKFEPRPGANNQDDQRSVFNPINFVPNIDLIKSQSMLNNKFTEPLPNQLNLVPLIPGGNFFKNTFGAQSELVQKPRLSSDLEKYAEEMFKESLKTIYNTHKWNNDRRARGNYSTVDLNNLAKLNNELQRFKASLPDPKYSGKDILEAHHSETKIRTAEPSRTTKKPELSLAAIEQLFKNEFKHNSASSAESSHNSHHKNKQNHGHGQSRPGSGSKSSNDFRNFKHLNDYLTPPKFNSFLSKSPFADSTKPIKKRPGSSPSRYNLNNSNSRPLPRPSSLVSRPASGPETSASNHVKSVNHGDGSRYEKHQHRPSKYSRDNDNYETHRHIGHLDYRRDQTFEKYPTFTTTSSPDVESFASSSAEQSSKQELFDINHPRTHNLLGLLMKNKQLPSGSSQNYFRDEDEINKYFESEKRRLKLQFYDDMKGFQKKSDAPPINMGPPAPPNPAQIRYYPGRGTA